MDGAYMMHLSPFQSLGPIPHILPERSEPIDTVSPAFRSRSVLSLKTRLNLDFRNSPAAHKAIAIEGLRGNNI